jgi:hypothetical protein
MPRGPRRDFSGALHHVIVHGIERRRIFREDADRQLFLNLIDTVCRRFGVSPGALGSRSLRSGVLAARAVLSYAGMRRADWGRSSECSEFEFRVGL